MRASTERTVTGRIPAKDVLPQQSGANAGQEESTSAWGVEDALLDTPDDLFERGLCYSTGQGVPQDLVRAHTYFNLAAVAGNVRAREMRSEVAQVLTPAEIATAQRLAREIWGRRH